MSIKTDYFPGLCYQPLGEEGKCTIGVVHNDAGTYASPTIGAFAYFNEHDFFASELILEKAVEIARKIEEGEQQYEVFVRQKGRRPSYDIYAGFQPFNEAFKAFFPFIKLLKKRLKPGDLILNLWDRTGWTAVLLAGLFPEQRVINVWEGDREALGYKGFHFWYGGQKTERDNVQFVFADLDQPLPYADDSVGLVVGFDALHRFDQANLLTELFRIVEADGAILFPHVHLSNAEPEPFFERGCRQLHGKVYDSFFQKMCINSGRKGYVFPEPEMFKLNELGKPLERPIQTFPDTHHYNAMIAFLPTAWELEEQLIPFRFDDHANWQECRVLINPLLDINLHQNEISQNPDLRAGRVGYLLERHPVYLEKLVQYTKISDQESIILYWSERLLTVAEIALKTTIPLTEVRDCLQRLERLDVLQLVPITEDQLRLQYFSSTQVYNLPSTKKTIASLWERAVNFFGENTYIWSELDDSELSYTDCNEIIQLIITAYHENGLVAGDHVGFICANHFEAVLAIQACLQAGMVAVPLDPHLAVPVQQHILAQTVPKIVFASHRDSQWLEESFNTVYLDDDEEVDHGTVFSDWLEDVATSSPRTTHVEPSHPACILYTSGSTGLPKGVVISQEQLVLSGRLITETFHWKQDSRFFSPGELDSMSGFRNHLIAPLEVGASIVIASAEHKAHFFSLLECMTAYKATILGTTPAFLGQILQFSNRSKPAMGSLTSVICTGSNLSPQLKQDFKEAFGLVPLNYYGLTETTGICLAESPDNYQMDHNTVGVPRACIVQIIDDAGEVVPIGVEGDLRIYSENCTKGYYQQADKVAETLRNGWIFTGDRAIRQPNGHVALLGRTRDIIKTASGQLVYAAEVENGIRQLNHLVLAVAVVGVEVENDEKIVAFVVAKPDLVQDEAAIKEELKLNLQRNIGSRKTPSIWYFIEELPVSSSGKVDKQALLKLYR